MLKHEILRAWGEVDWIRPDGESFAFGPDPKQIQRVFWGRGLDAVKVGVLGRDADGNTFLLHNAAAALEAELLRHLINNVLDTLGFEEPRAVVNG
ncbi:hypothetical protein GOA74_09055 [Sinorhizobium meliloti]|nr:hypothetical protein [Sinorhizobium meliloti]MDW9939573.1 hypothetical protein [Sinorhizobium meliloti]MDW9945970.1 hypothetical protein [Sinorhizobium meliloti]